MQRPDVWVSRSRLWAFPPFLKEQGWSLSYCFLLVVCFGLLPGRELNSISSESASVQILVCIYFASHLAVRILLSGPVTHFFCVLICFPLHPTWRWSSSIYILCISKPKQKVRSEVRASAVSKNMKLRWIPCLFSVKFDSFLHFWSHAFFVGRQSRRVK